MIDVAPSRPALFAGRGRGERLCRQARTRGESPHPKPSASTSPRKRGEVTELVQMPIQLEPLSASMESKRGSRFLI
jgi:hypothetical protein